MIRFSYFLSLLLVVLTTSMSRNKSLTIKSDAFGNNGFIPSKYTCDGVNINPPLSISNMPGETRTVALIMDDPDAPGTFDHWIMWNIVPTGVISENSVPGVQGTNGKKENNYTGPCPPSGVHRYHFKVYALDAILDLPAGSDKKSLEDAMKGHILAQGELIGKYKRTK